MTSQGHSEACTARALILALYGQEPNSRDSHYIDKIGVAYAAGAGYLSEATRRCVSTLGMEHRAEVCGCTLFQYLTQVQTVAW